MNGLSHEKIRSLVNQFYTPLYIFDEQTIRERCNRLKEALKTYENHRIRYACKALTIQAILKIIHSEGLWIDASSINEVRRALRAGFSPEKIYYTGEGATREVYSFLVEKGVLINCTSLDQIRLLGSVKPNHFCSIRINPGRGHGEGGKTNTGGPSSKHGIYKDQITKAKEVANSFSLKIIGIHSHIGSGSKPKEWRRWNEINKITLNIARTFSDDLEFVNLGGGLPVPYKPEEEAMDIMQWGKELSESMDKLSKDLDKSIRLFIEPGRYIVAECGLLVAEVQSVKSTPDEDGDSGYNYAIVNTGMNHNIRPAMYGSYHRIKIIHKDPTLPSETKKYVIAGYLCESGDVFTVDDNGKLLPRDFPTIRPGDLMVMENIGAYSHAMKNEYNSMNLPASILIDKEGQERVIERRGTLDDIMIREREAYNEHPVDANIGM